MKAKTLALMGVGTLMLAGAANADILGGAVTIFDNGVSGIDTYDVWAVVDDGDAAVSALSGFNVNATGGTFFNAAAGGILPSTQLFQGLVPDLVYDSYFTIGLTAVDAPDPGGPAALLALSMGSFANGATSFVNTEGAVLPDATNGYEPGDAAFAPQFVSGIGWVVQIARLSVQAGEGPSGTGVIGSIDVTEAGGDPTPVSFDSNDIPAPGALALLGLAGLAGSRRRRN